MPRDPNLSVADLLIVARLRDDERALMEAFRQRSGSLLDRVRRWNRIEKVRSAVRWVSARRRGRRSFVLRSGILGWGVPVFILVDLILPAVQGEFGGRTLREAIPRLLFGLVVWALGGAGFGLWVWHLNERDYLKHSDI